MKKPRSDALSDYHAKRSLGSTPEPAGAVGDDAGHLFVVHKHAARNLHYDLRLEMDGVLRSWAVPKEPSYDPADKRAAFLVEDHPLEYGDFEGVIPEGNYGAGPSIVWDRGVWLPLEDPVAGLEKGKLLFELRGYKLRGTWTLVKIKKSEKDWLLIKERDSLATSEPKPLPQGSVLSGLTVEQLRESGEPGARMLAEVEQLDAPRRIVSIDDVQPMLAEREERPFSRPGWIYELKYDGYRLLAGVEDRTASLRTRNGNDMTFAFPELARALAALPFGRLVLDGEVVVQDDEGIPRFQLLQQRARLRNDMLIRRAAVELPASYMIFDLLAFEDRDLRPLPLVERKRLLRRIVPETGALRYCDHIEERGEDFYAAVQQMQLEGMLAKRADSTYQGGRTRDWIKVRADLTSEFVVVGFTRDPKLRDGFSALYLAEPTDDGALTFAGSVGTGFDTQLVRELGARLDAIERDTPAFEHAPKRAKENHWVEPGIVVEVRYREQTREGQLRHPVFLRVREDLTGTEGEVEAEGERRTATTRDRDRDRFRGSIDAQKAAVSGQSARNVKLSNLDKVFWTEDGYTKGDLIEYYRAISPWMLPYLEDRPLVMTRYPDGIAGKSFYQKDAPSFAPDWLRTVRVWSEESQRELSYFVADDEASLVYIANMGTIPMHVWSSRVATLAHPDWCVIDLDPKEAPFEHVIEVALATRRVCDEIGLPCFIKTSGSSGLHVIVPVARRLTHDQSRTLGELVSRVVVGEVPDVATLTRVISKRKAKVYLDYLQNGHGKLLVAPYSVRPLPGAPVSMPLEWSEVRPGLDIRAFTIRTALERVRAWGADPLRSVLTEEPDLLEVLARLQERV